MKIGALIVLYNPDVNAVDEAVSRLNGQTDLVCLIDNSDTSLEDYFTNREHVHYIPLMGNRGIAAAQNIGISYLREQGMDFVLFSDQDSLCEEGLVTRLAETYTLLEQNGYSVATVGPVPINKITGKPYVTRQNIIEKFEISGRQFSQMYSVISSFSLTRISTFDIVGMFEEYLFIDGVDNEWCWRAMEKYGLNSFMVEDLSIQHYLGMKTRLPIRQSSPFRLYYQFRNFIILARRNYTPQFWKQRNAIKFAEKVFVYPLLIAPRWQYLKSIVKGCRDGLFSQTNKN